MPTFTSTLPDELLLKLNEMAGKLAIPKNKIIEKALQIYLDKLNRAEYVKSNSQATFDSDILEVTEIWCLPGIGPESYQVSKFKNKSKISNKK